jgi:holliday junction DNA helicase RuvB
MIFGLLDKEQYLDDEKIDRALRPETFADYIGQEDLIERLEISIEAAAQREEPLDHILLCGPPGLGKTSIANIIAKESGVKFRSIAAQSIKNVADLLDVLSKQEARDVLFIDEIHAIDIRLAETLYPAMEDYKIDIKLGNKDITKLRIAPFCLIGATTLPGKIPTPLRDRFGIIHTMKFYSEDELLLIITGNVNKLKLDVESEEALRNVAIRARGTPRIANRLLKRVRDYAQIKNNGLITNDIVNAALELEGIDQLGLTPIDRKYIETIYKVYTCGPCGIDPISASCGEDKTTIADYVEPYLVRIGFIARTPRGRVLTGKGAHYLTEVILKDER